MASQREESVGVVDAWEANFPTDLDKNRYIVERTVEVLRAFDSGTAPPPRRPFIRPPSEPPQLARART